MVAGVRIELTLFRLMRPTAYPDAYPAIVKWWSWSGSNRRNLLLAKQALSQLSYSPMNYLYCNMVEAVGVEPTMFPMSLIYSQLPSPLGTHLHNMADLTSFDLATFAVTGRRSPD